jgi:hypothetical protein
MSSDGSKKLLLKYGWCLMSYLPFKTLPPFEATCLQETY